MPWDDGRFDVTAWGATGNGTTDDTAAINDAIAAYNAAQGGVLYFPAGTYRCTAGLAAIQHPGRIVGDGGGYYVAATTLEMEHPSDNLFTISAEAVHMEYLDLHHTGASASSWAIVVNDGRAGRFQSVRVREFTGGMIFTGDCELWNIDHCGIKALSTCIRIESYNPDLGDWSITNSLISPAGNDAIGVYMPSTAGGRIFNNKINTGSYANNRGIVVTNAATTKGGILLIEGNSIEGLRGRAIDISTIGAGIYHSVLIIGNEFGYWYGSPDNANAIAITAAVAGKIEAVVITGNSFQANNNIAPAISLTGVDGAYVAGNIQDGFGSLLVSSGCTDLDVGGTTGGPYASDPHAHAEYADASHVHDFSNYSLVGHSHGYAGETGRWESVQYNDNASLPWPFVHLDGEIVVAFVKE